MQVNLQIQLVMTGEALKYRIVQHRVQTAKNSSNNNNNHSQVMQVIQTKLHQEQEQLLDKQSQVTRICNNKEGVAENKQKRMKQTGPTVGAETATTINNTFKTPKVTTPPFYTGIGSGVGVFGGDKEEVRVPKITHALAVMQNQVQMQLIQVIEYQRKLEDQEDAKQSRRNLRRRKEIEDNNNDDNSNNDNEEEEYEDQDEDGIQIMAQGIQQGEGNSLFYANQATEEVMKMSQTAKIMKKQQYLQQKEVKQKETTGRSRAGNNENNRDPNKDRKNGNPLFPSPSPLSPYQSKSKQSLSHSPLKQSSSTSTVQSDADEWVDIEKVEGKMQERIISAEVDIDSPLFLWNLQLKSGKLSGNLNSQLNQAENAGKPGQQSNQNKGSFNNQDDIKRSLVAITPLVLRAQQQKSQKQLQTYTFTSSISSQKSLQQLPPSKQQDNNDAINTITNRICPSPGTSISPSISSSPYLFRSSPSFTSINYSSYYQQTNQSSFSNYLTLSIPSLQTSLPLIPYANEDYLFLMRIVSISDQKAGNKERFALKQPSKVKVNLNIENIEDLIEQERSEIERENRNMRDGK
ncbi:MAG: hypothetical protein EZS28_030486, partial [Streblomastix strix]